jgi:hypothetical protein
MPDNQDESKALQLITDLNIENYSSGGSLLHCHA